MKLIEFTPEHARPIELFESVAASAVALGDGAGEAHVYCVRFGPGGRIGEHPAGFCQLFLVIEGEGWAACADGRRVTLTAGQGVFFERGETHSKGSETGMVAIMVQVTEFNPSALESS
jgi:quercetin dioxygenase-like cupin family protein